MQKVSVLKDESEIVHYNNPNIPVYVKRSRLSQYNNMEGLCHWHEDIEYIRVLTGHMAYYINGEKRIIQENDGILINSRQMHYGFSDDGTDCEFLCVVFRLQLLNNNPEIQEKYIRPIAEHTGLSYVYLQHTNPGEKEILLLFEQINQIYERQEPGFELLALGTLTAAWAKLFQLLGTNLLSGHGGIDEDLGIQKEMISFIHENYDARISLEEIAAAGNVCRSKCCKIFRKYLNRTPIEFLNAYRLEVSTRYLVDTPMSITEIALACGFQSPSYYTEIFRKYKGCTPRDYRNYL